MKRLLAVHQGFELYGSDRVFIRSLHAFRKAWPDAEIQVVLPAEGSLSKLLRDQGYDVSVRDMWVLRRSLGWKLVMRLFALPLLYYRARKSMSTADFVYINTSVILDYLLAARTSCAPVIVHVHELPTGLSSKILSFILNWSRAKLLFISSAVKSAYASKLKNASFILHNGHDGPLNSISRVYKPGENLHLLMIGRINDWKGQDLLIESLNRIPISERDLIEVKVAGDTFGGPGLRLELENLIKSYGLQRQVSIEGFLADPTPLYSWSHIVIAPSRKPEPFGLIAIEGMSWARPVIAASHGGLTEIVTHGETGRLFVPNDPDSLADSIRLYLERPELVSDDGARAREDYEKRFTAEVYSQKLTALVREMLK